jgi:hypothetical protein
MIDFIRENFSERNEQEPNRKLEENLRMQKDCEIEIERCREVNDVDGLEKTNETLQTLRIEEIELRKAI